MDPKSKPWWKSKTVWLNLAAILQASAAGLNEFLPVAAPLIEPTTMVVLQLIFGAANIVLRSVTDSAITKT
jgi:hypothetical protein